MMLSRKSFALFLCASMILAMSTTFYASEDSSKKVKAIDAAKSFTLAVDEDGTLWTWGDNSSGQLGTGDKKGKNEPTNVMKNVKKAACGGTFMLAISNTNKLYGWGSNERGQLGNGDNVNSSNPVFVMGNIVDIAAGEKHALALDENGNLYAWGSNASGQLGVGDKTDIYKPKKVMSGVKAIAAKGDSSYAITVDGVLYSWGENFDGQLGLGGTEDRIKPFEVLEDVVSIIAGPRNAYAVVSKKSGDKLYAWGDNSASQVTSQKTSLYTRPIEITYLDEASSIFAAGKSHFIAVFKEKDTNYIYGRGSSAAGQIGSNKAGEKGWALIASMNSSKKYIGLAAGDDHSIAITSSGRLFVWGANGSGQLGTGNNIYSDKMKEIELH